MRRTSARDKTVRGDQVSSARRLMLAWVAATSLLRAGLTSAWRGGVALPLVFADGFC